MSVAMQGQADRRLVDEAIQAYIDWREESAGVREAFDRWAGTRGVDCWAAFWAYRAALDREECASHAYAARLARVRRSCHV
jgi:hypothetical protein